MDTYIRLTFNLADRDALDTARRVVGALLRKYSLKYRTDKHFRPYRCIENELDYRWELSFSLLPPEVQPDNHLETLRGLLTHDLYNVDLRYPELADRVIYRNLSSFPHLSPLMQDWWHAPIE